MSNRPFLRSISSDNVPLSLGAAQLELVAAHQLRRDRQKALDAQIGEDPAGDVADPGDRAGLEQQRHPHRPGRQLAPPFGADVDKAGLVERDAAGWSADRHSRRCSRGPSSVHTSRTFGRSCWGTAPAGAAGRPQARPCRSGPRRSPCLPLATARSDGDASVELAVEHAILEGGVALTLTTGAVSRCSLPLRNGAGARMPVSR